tara:strand:+ start:42 stop:410 length:369 start_codon:yes stop_codon:yes gene_type:complete
MADRIIPLISQTVTQSVTVDATTKEIEVDCRTLEITVAAAVAGVATLKSLTPGLIFTIDPTVGSGGSITLTLKNGKTIIMDATNELVSLMVVDDNEVQVLSATDGALVPVGNTQGATGTALA